MKHRNLFIGLSCMAAGLCACNDEYTFVPEYEVKLPTDTTINVTIDASTVYQTIDGFASSDAWDMEYVGKYWSTSNKEAIAKLLFSAKLMTKGIRRASVYPCGGLIWEEVRKNKEMQVVLFQIKRNDVSTVF